MSDQQLADFRRFVEECEVGKRGCEVDAYFADLLRPALDEIDRLRAEVRTLEKELEIHA